MFADQSIMAHDEGLYATRAKLMFDTGDWINPWAEPHHKPPGIYWLIALSYSLFGVNEIALRLPNLVLALGCVLLVYKIAVSLCDQKIALLAGGILSLEFLWVRYSYLANPDHITIFLFLGALNLCYTAQLTQKIDKRFHLKTIDIYLFAVGICFAMMLLFRGFLGLMLIFSLVPYLIQKRLGQKLSLYVGLSIGLLPLCIWLLLSSQRFGSGSIESLVNLFVSLSQEERRGNGYFYYLWTTLGLGFPWVVFAGLGYREILRLCRYQRFLLVIPPTIIFGAITLYSTRLSHYSLALYPFMAIFTAMAIERASDIHDYQGLLQKTVRFLCLGLGIFGGIILSFGVGISLLKAFDLSLFRLDLQQIPRAYLAIAFPLGLGWLWAGLFAWQRFDQRSVLSLLVGQWLAFVILAGSGLLTDVSPAFKAMVKQPTIQAIANTETIAVIGGGKTKVLIRFYFPHIDYQTETIDALKADQYVWIETEHLPEKDLDYEVIANYNAWQFIQLR
ncbi:ArnT family glycosyltransferase [Picosynechococcus sp. PCC 11901]|uniref:ArnT family glycosyltransferase n=1 Tax=Picosynechococcus sp. PCC 11901 TaxID=2579791 RepID=UPI0030DC00B2